MTNANRLRIEFLFLDIETCTRCRATDRNLETALAKVEAALAIAGTEVEVTKIHVESAEQARELRFISSPTIRVNGRDIALELRESSCGSEACTDGCGDSVGCRVWVHDGEQHTEPPVAMILNAILSEVYRGAEAEAEPQSAGYELPENLYRFFAGKAAAASLPPEAGCCSPAEQSSCCDAADKAECCATGRGDACGCR